MQVHATDPVPPHPARVVVHVSGGSGTGSAAAASGKLIKKGTAP